MTNFFFLAFVAIIPVARFLNSRPEKGARVTDALNELQRIYVVAQDYNGSIYLPSNLV